MLCVWYWFTYFLHRYCFKPFGKSLGIVSKNRKLSPNAELEKAYRRNSKLNQQIVSDFLIFKKFIKLFFSICSSDSKHLQATWFFRTRNWTLVATSKGTRQTKKNKKVFRKLLAFCSLSFQFFFRADRFVGQKLAMEFSGLRQSISASREFVC